MLATGQATTTIVSGQRNALNLTFGGVVKSVAVLVNPTDISPGAPANVAVTVAAKDASGFTIVGGDPYTTPIRLTSDDASGATALSTTEISSPSTQVTLAYNGSTSTSAVNIGATVPDPSISVSPGTLKIHRGAPSPAPSGTPMPTPTPSHTASPTTAPTSAPVGSPQNAAEWPSGFRPYSANSIWNTKLTNTTNPVQLTNSAAIVGNIGFHYTPINLNTQEFGGLDDVSHPVVFASASDPLVTAQCVQYCSGWSTSYSSGVTGGFGQIRIPAKARPSGSTDHHLAVIQPDGTEIDMWAVIPPSRDWQTGDTIQFGDGQNQGNFYTGEGQAGLSGTASNAATAGGAALAAGLIRQSELSNHLIPHALFLASGCVGVAHVYPAIQNGDNTCNGSGAQVPFGAHFWFSMSDSAIDALANVSTDQKTILHALHQYGGYVMDSGGNTALAYTDGIAAYLEDGTQFSPFGATPPLDSYAQSAGWPTQMVQVMEYYQSDNSGLNWAQFFQILDPCYAQKTC